MNILIVANHYAVCSARYATDAFIRLGHTVRHVGTPMGRNIWGMQVPEEYVWTPDEVPEKDWVDLAICMDSDKGVILSMLEWSGVPRIVWGVDNHVRDYYQAWFEHFFLAHKSVSVMPLHYTEKWATDPAIYSVADFYPKTAPFDNHTWLPCAYDPIAFPPSPIAWEDRAYDVCMIGVMYPKRWELVNAMRAAGLKVFAGMGLIYDAYRDAYQNSRVALVSSFNGDLPIRLFEGAGMGCAVLSDEIGDLEYLDPTPYLSVPIITYQSTEEAVQRAKDIVGGYSGTPAHWLADQCRQWAEAHTFDIRAQVIIDWYNARKNS